MDKYVQYTNSLMGRDKLFRFGQYLARLLVYLLGRRTASHGKSSSLVEWLETFRKVQTTLTTTRKVMRTGKFVDFARQSVKALTERGVDEVGRLLSAVHKAGMCIFMAADTLGVLGNTLGLVRLRNAQSVTRWGQRAWVAALVAQAAGAAYKLHNVGLRQADLQRVRKHVEKTDRLGSRECAVEEQMLAQQRVAANKQLVQGVLDLAIPVKNLGLVDLNEGMVALAGTVTSVMGMRDAMSKASAGAAAKAK
ncbi:peroxisomal biogenesis factor 11 [Coemansia spiralis]|nr:peroxisomal biogenesis factor 11 [Coemansia spiralis]